MSKTDITRGFRRMARRGLIILIGLFMVVSMSSVNFAFGADKADKPEEKPIREVHKVAIENKLYCFFVTHNVVLTPAEIAGMTDEELTGEIFKVSGLYMKEANCRLKAHKAISPEDWAKKGGRFLLDDSDIEQIRQAEPADGSPVKLHMDVRITVQTEDGAKPEDKSAPADKPKPEDGNNLGSGDAQAEGDVATDGEPQSEDEKPEEEAKGYSTFKRTSPRIIFIAVATETDAAYGEEICEEEPTPVSQDDSKKNTGKKQSKKKIPGGNPDGGEDSEMLPEFRTISMLDRSGGKLEKTLEDGTPVTLEWIEPKKYSGKGDGKSFIEKFPGGAAGLTVAGIIVAGLIAAAAVAIRKNQEE